MPKWTPELNAQILRLDAEGNSASKIADIIGIPGHRGAVIGRLNRLKGVVFDSDRARKGHRRRPGRRAAARSTKRKTETSRRVPVPQSG